MSDFISRQAAIDALWKSLYEYEDKTEKQFKESEELDIYDWIEYRIFVQNMSDIDRQTLLDLPPAQPEQRWIPFQFRPMTDEEKEEFLRLDIDEDEEILCGENPDDGQEILVSYNGYVFTDTFEFDEGYYLDGMGEIEHGMAWMPLPEPYKEQDKTRSQLRRETEQC